MDDPGLYEVLIATQPSVSLGTPRLVFRASRDNWRGFDVTPDGERFLVVRDARSDDAEYYRRRLQGVAGRLSEAASPFTSDQTVELFKSFGFKGLQPIDDTRLERARELARAYAGGSGHAAP